VLKFIKTEGWIRQIVRHRVPDSRMKQMQQLAEK